MCRTPAPGTETPDLYLLVRDVVRGESWLSVAVVGQPEDAALLTIEALAGPALERLPPTFFVLPPDE